MPLVPICKQPIKIAAMEDGATNGSKNGSDAFHGGDLRNHTNLSLSHRSETQHLATKKMHQNMEQGTIAFIWGRKIFLHALI
jgi:hypothetical protein